MMARAEIYTVAGASRVLGYGLPYTYGLVYSGKLDAVKVDGKWQIPASAVQAILAKRSARGVAPALTEARN
jgi:excisionase family DNA binding protein